MDVILQGKENDTILPEKGSPVTAKRSLTPKKVRRIAPITISTNTSEHVRTPIKSLAFEATLLRPIASILRGPSMDILSEEELTTSSLDTAPVATAKADQEELVSPLRLSCSTCVSLNDRNQQLSSSLSAKQRECHMLRAKLVNAEENCKQYEVEFEKLRSEAETLKTQAREFHRACATKQGRIEELQATLSIANDQIQNQAIDMQASIQEKQEEILSLRGGIQEREEEIDAYSSAYNELQSNHDSLVNALQELKMDLALRDAMLAEYRTAHEQRMQGHDENLETLRQCLDANIAECESLRKEVSVKTVKTILKTVFHRDDSASPSKINELSTSPTKQAGKNAKAARRVTFDMASVETRMAMLLGRIDQATDMANSLSPSTSGNVSNDSFTATNAAGFESVMPEDFSTQTSSINESESESETSPSEMIMNPFNHTVEAIPTLSDADFGQTIPDCFDGEVEEPTQPAEPVTAFTPQRFASAVDASSSTTPLQTREFATMTSPFVHESVSQFVATASTEALIEQIDMMNITNDVLRNEHKTLLKQLAKEEKTVAQLKASLEQEIAQSAAIQADFSASQTKWMAYKAENQATLAEIRQQQTVLGAQLQQTLEDKDIELSTHMTTVTRLQEVVNANMIQINNLDETIISLRQQLQTSMTESAAYKTKTETQLHEQMAINATLQNDMKTMYKNHKREVSELKEEFHNQAYKDKYHTTLQHNHLLTSRLACFTSLVDKLQNMTSLENVAHSLTTEARKHFARVAQELKDQRESVTNDRAELEQQQQQFASTLNAAAELRAIIEQNEGMTISEFSSALTQLKELTATSSLSTAIEAVNSIFNKANELQSAIVSLQQSFDILNEKHNALIVDFEQTKCANNESVAGHNDQVAALQQQLTAHQQSLETAQSEREQAIAMVNTLKTGLVTAQAQAATNAKQYNELKEFVEEEREIRQDMMNELERDVESAHSQLQQAVQTHQSEMEQLKVSFEEQQKDLQEALNNNITANKEMEREFVRMQSALAMAENDIMEKELAIAEAQSLLEQTKEELAAAKRESSMAITYKKEVNDLSVYLQEYQAKANHKIAMLQSNLAKAEAEVKHLDAELMRMLHKVL